MLHFASPFSRLSPWGLVGRENLLPSSPFSLASLFDFPSRSLILGSLFCCASSYRASPPLRWPRLPATLIPPSSLHPSPPTSPYGITLSRVAPSVFFSRTFAELLHSSKMTTFCRAAPLRVVSQLFYERMSSGCPSLTRFPFSDPIHCFGRVSSFSFIPSSTFRASVRPCPFLYLMHERSLAFFLFLSRSPFLALSSDFPRAGEPRLTSSLPPFVFPRALLPVEVDASLDPGFVPASPSSMFSFLVPPSLLFLFLLHPSAPHAFLKTRPLSLPLLELRDLLPVLVLVVTFSFFASSERASALKVPDFRFWLSCVLSSSLLY